MEPRLVSNSIAIRAPVKLGSLITNTETRTYSHAIKSTRTYNLQFEIRTGRTALEAFPDEVGVHSSGPTHPVHLLILVSTAHELSAISPLSQERKDSINTLGMTTQTTYSGTGILLIPVEEYVRCGAFHSRIKKQRKELPNFESNIQKKIHTKPRSGKGLKGK